MTDKDTPTPRTDIDDPEQVDRIRRLWARLDYQEALIDKLERETVELRQQLAALEQKRKEDVRKCEQIGLFNTFTVAEKIRAAFPDVFKEKNNDL